LGFSRLAAAVRTRPWPLYSLLIAAYPVLFLYGQNVGELTLDELVAPLTVVVGIAAIILVVGALVLGDVRRAALPVAAIALMLLMYGHGVTLVRPLRVPALVYQGAWIGILAGSVVLALFLSVDRLRSLTRGLNVVAAVLIALVLISIVPTEVARFGKVTSVAAQPTATVPGSGAAVAGGREIWYLVFDRYGSRESLQELNDWDDGPFLDALRQRGFVIAEQSHANYLKTMLSLAATLNLDYLDDLIVEEGVDSNDMSRVHQRVSDHAVGRYLQERGYEYVHVGSWFGRTRTSAIADRNLFSDNVSDFVTTLEEASAWPPLRRWLRLSKAQTLHERIHETTRAQLGLLEDLAGEPARRFVFGHVLLPHPPYVFAADGSFEDSSGNPINPEAHNRQITYLHGRMLELIDRLLARPEAQRPIIILQGDEGPFPVAYAADPDNYDWSTASDADFRIKYGILNAWYVPDDPPLELPATISSVNTFRILFNREFGADLPLLEDRSYVSVSRARPYDMTDITDRLEPAGGD
jgi:hypothetical protein